MAYLVLHLFSNKLVTHLDTSRQYTCTVLLNDAYSMSAWTASASDATSLMSSGCIRRSSNDCSLFVAVKVRDQDVRGLTAIAPGLQ